MKYQFLNRISMLAMLMVVLISFTKASTYSTRYYIAYSLKSAQRLIESSQLNLNTSLELELRTLGGINHPVAFVVDRNSNHDIVDIIIIGEHDPEAPDLLLDDLATNFKVAYLYGLTAPGVTIEPRKQKEIGDEQDVIFFGGIENTNYGNVSFLSDYLVKQIGFETVSSKVLQKQTYRNFAIENAREQTGTQWNICSRFWYYPTAVQVQVYNDAVVLQFCKVEILTQTLWAEVDRSSISPETYKDVPAEKFANTMNINMKKLGKEFPVLTQLQNLASLTALAKGLVRITRSEEVDYWLNKYHIAPVKTATTVKTLRTTYNDGTSELYLFGGVRILALTSRSIRNDSLSLVDQVTRARPSPKSLNWTFAIGWMKAKTDPEEEKIIEHLKQALYLLEFGKYAEALNKAQLVLEIDPHLAEAWHLKGIIYRQWGAAEGDERKISSSVACLQRSVRAYPRYADAHTELASSYNLLRNPEKAIKHYSQAMAIVPDDYRCYIGLAYALNLKGERAKAIGVLKKYLELVQEGLDAIQVKKMLAKLQQEGTENLSGGNVYQVYSNSQNGFAFQYPGNWNLISSETTPQQQLQGCLNVKLNFIVGVVNPIDLEQYMIMYKVNGHNLSSGITMGSDFDNFLDALESGRFPGLRMISTLTISIGGTRAIQYTARQTSIDSKIRFIVIRRDQKTYLLIFTASSDTLQEADNECFQAIIKNFRFK